MMRLFLVALALGGFLLKSASGFHLRLESTEHRCVYDLLKKDMLATGHYLVDKKDDGQQTGVHITVTDPFGETVFATENAEEGKFAFTAKSEGKYTTCMQNTNLLTKEIDLKLKSGVEAKDLSEVAQRDHLMPLGVELLRLEEVAEEIRAELKALFKAEADMREVNDQTNSRVRYTTMFSVIVIIAVGTWQVFHVRRFLTSKKVV